MPTMQRTPPKKRTQQTRMAQKRSHRIHGTSQRTSTRPRKEKIRHRRPPRPSHQLRTIRRKLRRPRPTNRRIPRCHVQQKLRHTMVLGNAHPQLQKTLQRSPTKHQPIRIRTRRRPTRSPHSKRTPNRLMPHGTRRRRQHPLPNRKRRTTPNLPKTSSRTSRTPRYTQKLRRQTRPRSPRLRKRLGRYRSKLTFFTNTEKQQTSRSKQGPILFLIKISTYHFVCNSNSYVVKVPSVCG